MTRVETGVLLKPIWCEDVPKNRHPFLEWAPQMSQPTTVRKVRRSEEALVHKTRMNLGRSLWKCEEGKTTNLNRKRRGWKRNYQGLRWVLVSRRFILSAYLELLMHFMLCFSIRWLLGRVVANKLSYQTSQQTVFCVRHFLSRRGYYVV